MAEGMTSPRSEGRAGSKSPKEEVADSIELKDGLTRFEHRFRHAHHDHMICTNCGTILEFLSPEIERLQDEIAEDYGFTIESHRHQMFGLCQKCSRKRRRNDPHRRDRPGSLAGASS